MTNDEGFRHLPVGLKLGERGSIQPSFVIRHSTFVIDK